MQNIPVYKRILSFLYPVLIRRAASESNPLIEIYLYRGQWQLATADALYSDGNRYRPLLAAFKEMKPALASVKKVLVLGAGLGSAVSIMKRIGFNPSFTLVDIDKLVLQWALEFSEHAAGQEIIPVCADALDFISKDTKSYDLIVVDIFLSQVVPQFVTELDFLESCKKHLKPGGQLVFNYIINDEEKWYVVKKNFDEIFPENKIIKMDVNRVFIAGG